MKHIDINKIKNLGKKIKLDIFKKFIEIKKEKHPGSILSIFDIVNCLYLGNFIKCTKNVRINDYFIVSKGHAGSFQYPYLLRKSIINKIYRIISSNNYFKENITLIDLFRGKLISDELSMIPKQHFHTLVFGEQYENFNISTLVLKYANKHCLNNIIVSNTLRENIGFGNDGRENILDRNNLSTSKIFDTIKKYI